MFKVEDFQSYGKEHFEQYVASATSVQHGGSPRGLPSDRWFSSEPAG